MGRGAAVGGTAAVLVPAAGRELGLATCAALAPRHD